MRGPLCAVAAAAALLAAAFLGFYPFARPDSLSRCLLEKIGEMEGHAAGSADLGRTMPRMSGAAAGIATAVEAEPEWAAGLLKIKYARAARALPSPLDRAAILYLLSVKSRDSGLAGEAFAALASARADADRSEVSAGLARQAMEAGNARDFIRFFMADSKSFRREMLLFELASRPELAKAFSEYASKNARAEYAYQAGRVAEFSDFLKRNPSQKDMENFLFFYPAHLGLTRRQSDFTAFLPPIVSQMSFISGDAARAKRYADASFGAEAASKNIADLDLYLKYTSSILASQGRWKDALEAASHAQSAHSELKILAAASDFWPRDAEAIGALRARVSYLGTLGARLSRPFGK